MTDDLSLFDDFDDDDPDSRQHGFWVLAAIALVAASIVVILGFVLDHKHSPSADKDPNPNLINNFSDGASPIPTPTPVQSESAPGPTDTFALTATAHTSASSSASTSLSASTSPTASASRSKSATPTPTHTRASTHAPPPGSCGNPCGQDGGVTTALNTQRQGRGLAAVTSTVTEAAIDCANPKIESCSAPYTVTPISSFSGTQAIDDLLADGSTDLLSPRLSSIEVGWYYAASSNLYYVAILENE